MFTRLVVDQEKALKNVNMPPLIGLRSRSIPYQPYFNEQGVHSRFLIKKPKEDVNLNYCIMVPKSKKPEKIHHEYLSLDNFKVENSLDMNDFKNICSFKFNEKTSAGEFLIQCLFDEHNSFEWIK